MKKIPGTLYQLEIKEEKSSGLILTINYRNDLVLEKSQLNKEKIITIIQDLLENSELSVPKNRIEWIVKEELKNIAENRNISFSESTVSELIDQFQKTSSDQMKKIILIGLSNAGKTCIFERIFEGKKPWELMNSVATKGIQYKEYKVGPLSKPVIWDLGGQEQYLKEYHGKMKENIFQKASILIYVLDASDVDRFEYAKKEFEWAAKNILLFNPKAKLYIFLHKMDKIHDKNAMTEHIKNIFSVVIENKIKFLPTSIFDESLFNAWSEIIREISPKSTFINSILKQLKNTGGIKDVLLIEKNTGLACGSTVDISEEDIILGMISLLIITIDRVTTEMKLRNLKQFSLRADDGTLLLSDITKDLMLVIILNNSNNEIERLKEIEYLGSQVSDQIRNLWAE